MSAILVTGGAGYIGSHTVRHLLEQGEKVLVLDDLCYGHREALADLDLKFFEGNLEDAALLERIFAENEVQAVVHFAAFAYVGESVTDPLKYYRNNLAAPLVLLEAMKRADCKVFVFSSTCATYGEPEKQPITESEKQSPVNPYGQSKLMLEKVLADCDRAWGLKAACLRYFNACGAHPTGIIGEDHSPETHLIPLVLETALGLREKIIIFGTDYPTPDGTCIRDYIHVQDLAAAHLSALEYLQKTGQSLACNLGTGTGTSVQEIIDIAKEVTGREIPTVLGERRPGDPPVLVADPSRANELLEWTPAYPEPRAAIEHAWQWHSGPKKGRY